MKGFQFGGIPAGIKKNGKKDLGLIYCEKPAAAAALFTKNKVVAAPVILGRERMKNGLCQAILVNSGNANCFTGEKGLEDARASSKILSDRLGIQDHLVQVSSTGVIGAPLPMGKFESGIPELVNQLSPDSETDFADAILTTDTCRKIITEQGKINGHSFTIQGFAKGSGMIRPDMATMLAFVCTDVQIASTALKTSLLQANAVSFNRITVDGDTSTNDSLFLLASGASRAEVRDDAAMQNFQEVLDRVCEGLAQKIVKDGEGATKLIKIIVKGAQTQTDAFKAAEAIAHSNLVKTAIYGEDPNWGRITAAAGRSGAFIDPNQMDLFFEDQPLVIKGEWLGLEAEKKAALIMKQDELTIVLDLNLGRESDFFWFCDFSENYVKINADYRS